MGPVRGEYVVGPPAKQQVERRSKQRLDLLTDNIVEELGQPTAQLETAGSVFLGSAGCLHHAVERNENGSNDLTHRYPPSGAGLKMSGEDLACIQPCADY